MALHLDLSGLKCPIPLMRTKKQLGTMAAGDVVEVVATDPHSREDFYRYCDGGQCSVLGMEQKNSQFVFTIRKEGAAA